MAQYKRILLKLSGESLMGGKQYGIDEVRLNEYATQIKEIAEMGVQIGIVIGGGNIFRGPCERRPDGDAGNGHQQFGLEFCPRRSGRESQSADCYPYGTDRRVL